ncbi:MAG: FecR family protein [Gammaproteobacteria bacterium]|nr:FecR family protein [Gammaproteobacteria bacterium]
MNNVVNIPERRQSGRSDIEAEARTWVIALDGERPTDEKLSEFRDWLSRSPLHKQAFKRVALIWNDLDHWSEFLCPEPDKQAKSKTPLWFGLPISKLATAAVLGVISAMLALAVYNVMPEQAQPKNIFAAEYGTAIGEIKTVALPDGSDVRLNTHSKMGVAYAESARIVRLTEGEAYFEVFHDPGKPFIVYAGKYAVKAVGTAFSVQVIDKGIELTVTDGRVEVAALKQAVAKTGTLELERIENAASLVPLVKGQRVIFNEENEELELAQEMTQEAIEKNLSWRDGMFIFNDDLLTEVIAEINRYTPVKIVISDPNIQDLRFGGYFRIDDIPAILETIEQRYGIRVEQISTNLIYLSRR